MLFFKLGNHIGVSVKQTPGINNFINKRHKKAINTHKITNDWNYDAIYMLTSLPVSDLENSKHLIFFFAQNVQF